MYKISSYFKYLIILVIIHTAVYAEREPIFSEEKAVDKVFTESVFSRTSGDIVLLRDIPKEVIKEEAKEENKKEEKKPEVKKELTKREQIIKEYGNPKEDHRINPVDDSPKPYKGIIAALKAEDKELAYQYARQYVRYMKEVQDTSQDVVSLQGIAMIKEGMLPEGAWPSSPEYKDDHYLLKLDEEKENKELEKQDPKVIELNEEAKNLINKIKDNEYDLFNKPGASASEVAKVDEQTERLKARNRLTGVVPISTTGEVDVFVFFKPYDKQIRLISSDLEKLYQKIIRREDQKVSFTGLTIDKLELIELSSFRKYSKATFPVENGEGLSKQLKIKTSPTIMFMTPAEGGVHLEKGLKSYYYLDEVINILQGK